MFVAAKVMEKNISHLITGLIERIQLKILVPCLIGLKHNLAWIVNELLFMGALTEVTWSLQVQFIIVID
mgnify:CR=1 FL=1